jgi:hypothetical protein
MSETVIRDYSLTVRLSADEKVQLETLAERLNLDKSATVRRALQLAQVGDKSRLPTSGQFVPLPAEDLIFAVRLSGKAADGR